MRRWKARLLGQPDPDSVVDIRKRIQRILVHACLFWDIGCMDAWEVSGSLKYYSHYLHEAEVLEHLCAIGAMEKGEDGNYRLLVALDELDRFLDSALDGGLGFERTMFLMVSFMTYSDLLPIDQQPFSVSTTTDNLLESRKKWRLSNTLPSESIIADMQELCCDLTSLGFMEKLGGGSFVWTDKIATEMRANHYSW
jgi:hypothetical protein